MKTKYSFERYQNAIATLVNNNRRFSERTLGSRKTICIDNKPKVTIEVENSLNIGGITGKEFASFLGNFNRNLYYCLKNERLAFTSIIFNGNSRKKQKSFWDNLKVEDCFYNVDLKSAYWQVAHKLGYITTDFYEKYSSDRYKQAKRYCISFLARRNECTYFDGDDKFRTIYCDTSILNNVYKNIRNKLYICINDAIDVCDGEYLDYNIDAITIPYNKLKCVVDYFLGLGFEIKVTVCIKANEKQYYYGSKLRNF